jgi:protein TonB
MTRLLSFGGSTALHAGAIGAVLLAGAWGLLHEPPKAALAPSAPVELDVRLEPPASTAFEPPHYRNTLPIAEAELEFEPETVVEDVDVAPPAPQPRPQPDFDRPARMSDRLPEPKVEAELAAVEIHNPPPAYPSAARRRGQEGHALVQLKILKDGSVADPVVLECVGSPLFADAALKAVAAWRYQPATLGGVPVDRIHHVRFTFKLQT